MYYPRVVTRVIIMMPRNVSGIVAVHLHDVPDLGHVHKLINQPLAVHLGQDAALVVIPINEIE